MLRQERIEMVSGGRISGYKKRKHRATSSYPMFSGGEKNSFFYFSVIGSGTIATLTEKNRNFACSYNVLRYQ
jgi:hypothetical protein